MRTRTDHCIRTAQAYALMTLPVSWLAMLVLHFRSLAGFFTWRLRYEPAPADHKVVALLSGAGRHPMFHDPHWIGYLSIPVLALGAFGLYALGRTSRAGAAALGLSLTVIGCIFLGGVFGLITGLDHGMADVDPRHLEGAIAVYTAVTSDHGAYGITRMLAELTVVGLAVQAAALWGAPRIPRWAPITVCVGCALFLAFWDIDNLMLIGTLCLMAGFVPMARSLNAGHDVAAGSA